MTRSTRSRIPAPRFSSSIPTPSCSAAANLRRAFSGVVAGNVKDEGIRAVEQHGPFEIHGDKHIMGMMDVLLASFVEQSRMKLPGKAYVPCYRVIT